MPKKDDQQPRPVTMSVAALDAMCWLTAKFGVPDVDHENGEAAWYPWRRGRLRLRQRLALRAGW